MKKLYRSSVDKKIAGVCGGVGDYLGVDPTIVRVGLVIACVVTGFAPLLIGYGALWFIIPEEPTAGTSTFNPNSTM